MGPNKQLVRAWRIDNNGDPRCAFKNRQQMIPNVQKREFVS